MPCLAGQKFDSTSRRNEPGRVWPAPGGNVGGFVAPRPPQSNPLSRAPDSLAVISINAGLGLSEG
jgi:hypothetical protein